MPEHPPRLCVMLSGSGRTLENLIDHIRGGDLRAEIALVIASRPCKGVEIGKASGIESVVIDGDVDAIVLGGHAARLGVDLIVLAGYLRKVAIPLGFEGRVINIHPALLPKHGGPGMYGLHVHRAVLDAGDAESGCTVHLCDDSYDTGPILLQRRCPVLDGDTPELLASRVFAQECIAYPRAIADYLDVIGRIE